MKTITEPLSNPQQLKTRWEELKREYPKLRSRDAADQLGVSEAELIASVCDGVDVIRLTPHWEEIFMNLEPLGRLMALTRNASAVHEKTGLYRNVSFQGHAGLVLDEQIDLRIFHKRWGFGYAVPVRNPKGTLHSLQFFDRAGDAVHKIYLRDETKMDLYRQLIEQFRHSDQSPDITVSRQTDKHEYLSPDQIDKDLFLDAWAGLEDTHDFFPLLKKFNVDRTDALRLGRGRFTWKVSNRATDRMLHLASAEDVHIMVFVKNSGMIQIHSGPVQTIRKMDSWLNVLDQEFNLHLREDQIAESWIVEKPTKDGTVTSLELFDSEGEQIATFFGARKPGKPELESWRTITNQLKESEETE
ncbi:MAG: ChuX/HutX family heme-like substrate-binding protein [Balneolaceae bacterium]